MSVSEFIPDSFHCRALWAYRVLENYILLDIKI